MYLPCGPLPTLQARKSRIKSVKSALLVPRPSRVGEEQRGFGTFRNRLSPRAGKGVNKLRDLALAPPRGRALERVYGNTTVSTLSTGCITDLAVAK